MITNTLCLPSSPELEQLLRSEAASFTHGRASYAVERKGKELRITIEAADAVALRTVVTSVTRVINIHEKAVKVR